ncbi:MAG: type II toxin-antitoxin system RelE/ParE family toxin [Alphaproteobacteria bacterium]|nr:type II toxin-antitoxin system RelE/ParE family toxin [Alphaproteobacteria bacterium]
MARLVVSPEAENDIDAIAAFIAQCDGATRAMIVANRIRQTMENLAFMPGVGGKRHYLDKLWRAFPVSPWTIYYKLQPDGDGIEVLRVVDGRRDLPALFKGKSRRRPRRDG